MARHPQRALVLALLASLILWNLPFGGVLLYPFKLLATWMHELSHGLVMLLTGAGFDRMELYQDTSGLAFARRGVSRAARVAIAASGYMGTPLLGGTILLLGQNRDAARAILAGLGMTMAVTGILFVHGGFGMTAVLIGALGCLAGALFAPASTAGVAVNVIAAQACVNAVLDIRVLFRQNLVVNGEVVGASDAHNMAEVCFGTPMLWASVWLLWSFVMLFVALRLLYVRQKQIAPP